MVWHGGALSRRTEGVLRSSEPLSRRAGTLPACGVRVGRAAGPEWPQERAVVCNIEYDSVVLVLNFYPYGVS